MLKSDITFDVMGCVVTDKIFTVWEKLLVTNIAPFFISHDIGLPDETLILSRETFAKCDFTLAFHDSYATYNVSPQAKWVVLLTSSQFDALPMQTKQYLLAEQCKYKRGQIYHWEQVEPLLQEYTQHVETRCINLENKRYFMLDTKIWLLLTQELRQKWLINFITSDAPPDCLSSIYASKYTNYVIQHLAGTFTTFSGANCFSTTLAAITHDEIIAHTIANFWLHQEPFFQGLARRKYKLQNDLFISTPKLREAVLVWYDTNGQAQHACYLIENGLVLNKNSQAWFAPRQILRLQTVLDYWQDEDYEIAIYCRDD